MEDKRIADLTSVPDLILERMVSGEIDALLPLSIIEEQGRITGIYSTEGRIPVSDSSFSPVNVLELTGRIFKMLDELSNNLIFPDEIVLNDKIIFIDTGMRKTRICMIPEICERSEKENVSYLLNDLKPLTDERGRAYLDVLIREYSNKRFSTAGLLSFLEDLKREAGME